jgi:hypothetical protein
LRVNHEFWGSKSSGFCVPYGRNNHLSQKKSFSHHNETQRPVDQRFLAYKAFLYNPVSIVELFLKQFFFARYESGSLPTPEVRHPTRV